jgi:hypothetical protein
VSADPRTEAVSDALRRSDVGPWLTLLGVMHLHYRIAEVAVAALDAWEDKACGGCDLCDGEAEADLRERIAQAIDRERCDHAFVVGETIDSPATDNPEQRGRDYGIQLAYERAVRIARGQS